MDGWDIFYQGILLIAFLASFVVLKSADKYFKIFPILLAITNVVELTVLTLKTNGNLSYPFLYHIYIPIEYSLLAFFYFLHLPVKWAKRSALISIPVLVLFCIVASGSTSNTEHPTLQFTITGICLIALSLISLFSIEHFYDTPIISNPIFLINTGMLIFYSGSMLLMGSYNYLKHLDAEAAGLLFRVINRTLNTVLYTLFIIAFLCTSKTPKS